MNIYNDSWDKPHQHNGSELWQESDWLAFYDSERRVGATYRLGQRPLCGSGQPSLFVFADKEQRFLLPDKGGMGTDLDISPDDRWENGCRVEGHRVDALGNGELLYSWDYPETSGELRFHDQVYMPRDWSKSGRHNKVVSDMNAGGHLECAGRVRGEVRIADKRYSIDCYGHRDRSWGERDNYVNRMRRCLSTWGSSGHTLSYAAALMEFDDGRNVTTGFVVRNGVEEDITALNLITTLDGDMATPLAGKVVIGVESGEWIKFDCDLKQAFGGFHPGSTFAALGEFGYRQSKGFCCYSMVTNTGRGEYTLTQDDVSGLALSSGLSSSFSNNLY